MRGIVRSGRSFGVILNWDDGQRLVAHAFDALIVEIDVRYFDFGWETAGEHRKAVIVRSDLDVAVLKILYRLITSAMTEPELKRFSTEGASQQLMAKADAERGHA